VLGKGAVFHGESFVQAKHARLHGTRGLVAQRVVARYAHGALRVARVRERAVWKRAKFREPLFVRFKREARRRGGGAELDGNARFRAEASCEVAAENHTDVGRGEEHVERGHGGSTAYPV